MQNHNALRSMADRLVLNYPSFSFESGDIAMMFYGETVIMSMSGMSKAEAKDKICQVWLRMF